MLILLPLRSIARAGRVLRRVRRDQRGFTLVETLVAMVTGIVVTGALFTILDFSVKQSARLSGSAQATQLSRVAMTHIVEQLHSSCLSTNFAPVIKESSATKLIFVNGYDEKEEPKNAVEPPAELPAASIHKDVIEYNKATKLLTDTTYKATSNQPLVESEPKAFEKYAFSATGTTVRLAEHVSQMEEGGSVVPVFKYYAFATTSSATNGAPATTLNENSLTTESSTLTEANAKEVASVVVSFRTAPAKLEAHLSSKSEQGTVSDLTTQTTFAFGAPNSESAIVAGPCE
jgi:type II secretory pathway pseudopilin PulG